MPKLNKSGEVFADDWQVQEKEQDLSAEQLSAGKWLVHVKWYLAHKDTVTPSDNLGVWLDSDDEASDLGDAAKLFPVVGVNFPVFSDGRGFSIGRTLRERYGFAGELRALGGFMQDQLFYLQRCGFDAFIIKEDANVESMRQSLRDFSDFYQAAVDQPTPLFRRRLAKQA